MKIGDLKEKYRIPDAWRDLGLTGEPGKICRCPFPGDHKHGDANPSFSVYDEGRRAKDFATGDDYDVIDFLQKARNCNLVEALRYVEDRLRVRQHQPPPPAPATKTALKLPPLRSGTKDELRELADRRGFAVESLQYAEHRGWLKFTRLWGYPAWCITDVRQALFEFRRLDGNKWPAFGRLPERKSHCLGTGKNWPMGTIESERYEKVVMVEGAPDFLAAIHFLLAEGKELTIAPVAILGASNQKLSPEALGVFQNKVICLYPHVDESGRCAARAWARQLIDAGAARVTAFDLSGLVLADGSQGKDLADVCRICPDCLEKQRKFTEVMP